MTAIAGVAPSGLVGRLARFGAELRRLGVSVSLTDEIDAAKALALVDIGDHREVRLALRCSLKVARRFWPDFDRLFWEMWRAGGTGGTSPPRSRPRAGTRSRRRSRRNQRDRRDPMAELRKKLVRRRAFPADETDESEGPVTGRAGYSPRAAFRRKSFELCTEEELAGMERIFAQLAQRLATRRSRRFVPSRRGSAVDVRKSFRHSIAQGGEIVWLARRERAVERPKIVVLCDTSGSMDSYTRFFLAFVLALKRAARDVEIFAFNTSLVRLTPRIVAGDVTRTLEGLARRDDWSGGTRIGECLSEFVNRYLRTTVSSDTSVLIFSDGLDRGDAEALVQALRVIRRRARRLIWLNPLMGYAQYEPEARGMQAALPHIDALVPAHNTESLAALLPMVERG